MYKTKNAVPENSSKDLILEDFMCDYDSIISKIASN